MRIFTVFVAVFLLLFVGATSVSAAKTATINQQTQSGLNYIHWMLFETWNSSNHTASWQHWYQTKNKDGNAALRYTVAHMGYTAAIAAHIAKTQQSKSTTDTSRRLLVQSLESVRGAIYRLLDYRVWSYYEMFGYDSPVFKNVMFTGHLAQLLTLYQFLSGDDRFETEGFDLVWPNQQKSLHFNTTSFLASIFDQVGIYGESPVRHVPGVPCEPVSIFIICNNFAQNAFARAAANARNSNNNKYDNKRNWTAFARPWSNEIINNGGIVAKNLIAQLTSRQYFALDYLLVLDGLWEPLGSEGSDAWALSFMKGWWPAESMSVLEEGYKWLCDTPQWKVNETAQTAEIDQSHLNPIGSKMIFPFPNDITTSFFPMVHAQFATSSNNNSKPSSSSSAKKAQYALNYLYQFQRTVSDRDGCNDCVRYESSENYRDWVTANVVAGQLLMHAGNPNLVREMMMTGIVPK